MSSQSTQQFMDDVKLAIQAGLTATLEAPVDEATGEPDWSEYDNLKSVILQGVMASYNTIIAQLEKNNATTVATPKVLKQTRKTGSSESAKINPYARWVSFVSHIRSGKTSGEDTVTIGVHFSKLDSSSSKKYHAMKDELGLHGKTMTVSEMLNALSVIPDARDMALNGISWGLVAPERRTELALNYNP